jgi:hypothetical protein
VAASSVIEDISSGSPVAAALATDGNNGDAD